MELQHEFTSLISTSELTYLLEHDKEVVLLDCRWEGQDPPKAKRDYEVEHIPSAQFVALEYDMSSLKTANTGRHPLPEKEKFMNLVEELGIVVGVSQVIVYDTKKGAEAASRMWWLLRYFFRHFKVAVLNGGFQQWQSEKRTVVGGIEKAKKRGIVDRNIEKDEKMLIQMEEVEMLDFTKVKLVDSRTKDRWNGLNEPYDFPAGRIPNAINYWFGNNFTPQGTFLPKEELKQLLNKELGNTSPNNVIFSCGSGVTACLNLIAMEYIGLSGSRLFVGSYSQWITNPNHLTK